MIGAAAVIDEKEILVRAAARGAITVDDFKARLKLFQDIGSIGPIDWELDDGSNEPIIGRCFGYACRDTMPARPDLASDDAAEGIRHYFQTLQDRPGGESLEFAGLFVDAARMARMKPLDRPAFARMCRQMEPGDHVLLASPEVLASRSPVVKRVDHELSYLLEVRGFNVHVVSWGVDLRTERGWMIRKIVRAINAWRFSMEQEKNLASVPKRVYKKRRRQNVR